jgi:hypothetical protein
MCWQTPRQIIADASKVGNRDDAAVASHLEESVKTALSRELLTINQICKFARKARYITSLLTLILLHWQMARMPLQLRIALNTS